jgi:hypothetical protein
MAPRQLREGGGDRRAAQREPQPDPRQPEEFTEGAQHDQPIPPSLRCQGISWIRTGEALIHEELSYLRAATPEMMLNRYNARPDDSDSRYPLDLLRRCLQPSQPPRHPVEIVSTTSIPSLAPCSHESQCEPKIWGALLEPIPPKRGPYSTPVHSEILKIMFCVMLRFRGGNQISGGQKSPDSHARQSSLKQAAPTA